MAPRRTATADTSGEWADIKAWAATWTPFAGTAIVAAIDELRALLEASDPWPGFKEGRPLAGRISVAIDGLPEWVRIAGLCRALDGDPELPELVRRLGQPAWSNYEGALVELELAGRLRKAGVDVRLLSQRAIAPNVGPADIAARLADREVLLECTALNPTAAEEHAHQVTERLMMIVLPNWGRPVGVRFEPAASPLEAETRFAEIAAAVHAASSTGTPAEVAGICQVTPLTTDRGPSWVLPLNGFEIEVDALRHARRALRAKAQKGFGPTPAVVVMRLHHLALEPDLQDASIEFAEGILADLDGFPAVSAVLAYEEWRGSPRPHVELSNAGFHVFTGRDEDGSHRLAILVRNAGATLPLQEQEVRRLIGHDMIW